MLGSFQARVAMRVLRNVVRRRRRAAHHRVLGLCPQPLRRAAANPGGPPLPHNRELAGPPVCIPVSLYLTCLPRVPPVSGATSARCFTLTLPRRFLYPYRRTSPRLRTAFGFDAPCHALTAAL
jgi:hypothetical protein